MPTSMSDAAWDIHREGRAWKPEEARQRFQLTPEKLEMFEGLNLRIDPQSTSGRRRPDRRGARLMDSTRA